MSGGWIKLHRKLLDSSIFTSDSGLRIWIWCLLRANHDECDVFVGIHKVHLMPGQFVFGRESASESLGISPSTVRNWINILQQDSRIDIKPTNKYSVISVLNWNDYQSMDNKKDNRITTEKQQNNTDKKDKKEKNIDTNVSIQPMADRPKKERDIEVDAILQVFEEVNGTIPVDQKPRQWAYLIKKSLTKYLDANKSTLKPSDSLRKFLVNKKEANLPISFNKLQTIYYHLRSTIYKNEKHQ